MGTDRDLEKTESSLQLAYHTPMRPQPEVSPNAVARVTITRVKPDKDVVMKKMSDR